MKVFLYFIRVALFWLVFFALAKFYFLAVNTSDIGADFANFPRIWWEGLALDLSIVGYFSAIPLLLLLLKNGWPNSARLLLNMYWWLVWVFALFTLAVDPYFFKYWGQKTNLGFTQFLGKENAGLLSIEWSTYLVAVGFMVVAFLWFYKKGQYLLQYRQRVNYGVVMLCSGLSFLMLRGSIGKVPINISSAYFSSNNLHNNTAANAIWSFLATEFERDKHKPLRFFDDDKAERVLAANPCHPSGNISYLIDSSKVENVLLIVLESFSAKTVGFISGEKYGSTPNLDAIMQAGIAYTNAYAASFRSDKGLLALTTGVPSGARQTLTNFPDKLANQPNIFRILNERYATSFYYGGNLEFANIKVLFHDADMQMAESDFASENNNAWGVHDEVVFEQFTHDFLAEEKPQFKMMFSLSSHEPFDVPNFNRKEDPYLNSIAYTDSCLGVLMAKIRKSDKWANTLIILTADHGTIRPDKPAIYDASNFKIPLVITGGVVKRDTIISSVVSQMEIPATISQCALGIYPFEQNTLLKPSQRAFYSFYNGITYISDSCTQHFSIEHKAYIGEPCAAPLEKAFFQNANQQFFQP